jgi:hypothetical protein
MKTLQNKKTLDAKNGIPTSASAKTGEFRKSHHNLQQHRKYHNIPVKFYNPARKTGNSFGGSFIDCIDSPPQPSVARSKDPISSPGNSEAITLNGHQPEVEKAESWKGALRIHYQKKADTDTPEPVSRDTKDTSEASAPKPLEISDIQDGMAKTGRNMQVEVATVSSPVTNVVAENEKGKSIVILAPYIRFHALQH